MNLSFLGILGFLLLSLGGVDLFLLAAFDLGETRLLGVLERGVVEVFGCLDQLHGQDKVIVLFAVDLHVAGALRVVYERTLHERDRDRTSLDIVLSEHGKV